MVKIQLSRKIACTNMISRSKTSILDNNPGSTLMKKKIAFALILLLCPTIVLAQRYGHPSPYGPRTQGYYRPAPHYSGGYPRQGSYHHHNDDWIVPVAIFGTVLGLAALSRPYAYDPPPPPLPPRRICRDTYNHYDEYGRYIYSTYVDRPCN
jgi:hypothetical protein